MPLIPAFEVGVWNAWIPITLLLLSAILIVISHFLANTEEIATTKKFGDAYREYMKRTPRWIGLPK